MKNREVFGRKTTIKRDATGVILESGFIFSSKCHSSKNIANLDSITFWERTAGSGPTVYTFPVNNTQLTTHLLDPLTISNCDIQGASTEYYDVFYSDIDGKFNLPSEYLTIEGVYNYALPAGAGLNLAEIGLNFSAFPVKYGNYVASF